MLELLSTVERGAQGFEVMVEHFVGVTRHKIGGHAKAMVVTSSRLEAVRYKQAFDRYIAERNYPVKSLVAFSGVVRDDKIEDKTYTEVGMNGGVREKELPDIFAGPDYQVLLVAEKYQTGFDQPLLHTMYVDRRLAGLQAVQTLSRLNRVHPLKEDTFILDFVNSREEIREAFARYYEGAEIGEEVEPARMYEIKAELDRSGIYLHEEVERFAAVFYKPSPKQTAADHRALNAALDPAADRFRAFLENDPDEAELWRRKVTAFGSLYGYLSQVIPYQDSDLERLYSFLRHLVTKLARRPGGGARRSGRDGRVHDVGVLGSHGRHTCDGRNGHGCHGSNECLSEHLHSSVFINPVRVHLARPAHVFDSKAKWIARKLKSMGC